MPDFNLATPDKKITDPTGILAARGAAFPRHVHRFVPEKTGDAMVVGWKGKTPIHNEYRDVRSDAELAAALEEGYALQPVLAPPEKSTKAAK